MTGRLDGKVALVTGGASGIGEATVRLFAHEGAKVVIGDVQDDRGERLAGALGDGVLYQHADVRYEDQVAAAVDRAVADFGRLDCVFANAGIVGALGAIDQIAVEEWDFTMAVNLRGVFLCLKHAARVMKSQGSGCILCTSSVAGLQGGLGPHPYATTKSALVGLTRNAAAELVSHGVRVNCIAPGNIATEMTADFGTGDPDNLEMIADILTVESPLPGRCGLPEDIARAALYLASDDGTYVSGHTLVVDAGLTVGSRKPSLFVERAPLVRGAGKRGLPDD